MTAKQLVTNNRGVATSLLETVIVIAIVAVISSVALVAAMGKIEDARLTRAIADTEMIGIGIHNFMIDTGYAPAFKSGTARGPNDPIVRVLETAGDEPEAASTQGWPSDPLDRDRLENHLVKNTPSSSRARYPRVGEIPYARQKGWNGPYLTNVPSSDPWGNKYLVNVQLLAPAGANMAAGGLPLGIGQRPAVFAVSAGPNRVLETRFDQLAEVFVSGADDIVFRIQ